MKNTRIKSLALLLAVAIALPLLSVQVLAKDIQGTDPYIYFHDEETPYWYRSPHRYAYTDQNDEEHSGYVPAMYQLTIGSSSLAAYCCDLVTSVEPGTAYRRINLEDAGYYSADAAAHIRGILKRGYWVNSDISGLDGIEDVNGLTAAEALAATQCAIWHFANTDSLSDIYVGTRAIRYTDDIRDAETVNTQEEASANTETNIEQVYDYLIDQTDSVPASVIWSFEGEQVVLTAKNDLSSYNVTVKFKMKGSKENVEELSLYAELLNDSGVIQTKSFDVFSDSALAADDAGYYTITFENVQDEDMKAAPRIRLKLSGIQAVQWDVYFYEPVNGRDTAQCFVGYGEGATPITCETDVAVEKGTTNLSLKKYDASVSGGSADCPVPGVSFALYVSVDGGETFVPYPGMPNKITDQNGEIRWEGLAQADNIQYAYQEVDTPDGYLITDDQWGEFNSNGYAEVGNSRALGDLTIGKSVTGTDSDRHFDFKVALDFSTADLAAAGHLTKPDIAGQYSILTAGYTGTDNCGQTHPGSVTFADENGLYTARISLADRESVTLRGIPVGTGYTVSELDENGGELTDGQAAGFSGRLYVCPNAKQRGVIGSEDAALNFDNVEYEAGTLILSGKKYLDGSLSGRKFSFALTDVSDASNPVLVETVENSESGTILFAPISYERAGTYSYEVRETGSSGEYSHDTAVYTVTVHVTQSAGENKLTVGAPVIAKSGSPVEEIAFYNTTKGGGDSDTSVTVKKVWELGRSGKAADSVTVALLRDGVQDKTAVLSAANDWTYTWDQLDDDHRWTVKELDVPKGFTVSVSQSGKTFTVTNTYKRPGTSETPDKPDVPGTPRNTTLPQTGLLWWPVPLLLCGGGLILMQVLRRQHGCDEK